MNRRDALAALVALPAITRIATAPVAPTDVIVVEVEEILSQEAAARIKCTLGEVWPGRQVVVLSKGMTLKVVAGGKT